MSVENMLSIVLPVYNDQDNLDRFLAELRVNDCHQPWELIVVDDGSPDRLSLGESPMENWQLIRHDQQRGAGAARNDGVRRARGEYIILLSVFLRIPEDYLERIARFGLFSEFDFAAHLLEPAPELALDHFQRFLAGQKDRSAPVNGQLSIKQSLFTAAIIKKEPYCKLKGFDESMHHYGGHEMDLIYRLDQAGYSNRTVIPDFPLQRVKIERHGRIRDRLQQYGSVGLPALLHKHPELNSQILIQPLLWRILSLVGLPKIIEKRLAQKIEANRKLPRLSYQLYLHLIVRNAWAAR